MLFLYIICMFHLCIVFGQELKQDSPGSAFNLKCSEGSYVSTVSSTFTDSGDDHRMYKVKCTKVPNQGATSCKPGDETEYSKDFAIGCSGDQYLAGLESTEFKNQDRKFRTLCCQTDGTSVTASSCEELSTRGNAGFNAITKKGQVIQKVTSKYVLSKQNGKFVADRSFVFTLCDTSSGPSNSQPNNVGEPPAAQSPSARAKNSPPKSSASQPPEKQSKLSNSEKSVQLPEKKTVVGTPGASSGPASKSSLPSKNPSPSGSDSKSSSPSGPPPSQSSGSGLKTRPKATDSKSSPQEKTAELPPKSQSAPSKPSSSSNSGSSQPANPASSSAAKSIASFNQRKTGGGSASKSGFSGGSSSSGSSGSSGGFGEETVPFQSFDLTCPTGSAIRAIKIKRIEQGSKRDASFSFKCEKLPDYIDTKDIEDQILGYTAQKDGSVQSPCEAANGQFLCGLKGTYEENRGVEAHCCRVKDTFPSFSQNPLTVVPTAKGGVLKADPSKEEFVGNLDQLSDGTFVGQMIVFGKLYPVKGTNILTAEGCRCKCDCTCPKNKTRRRRRRTILSSVNSFTYQLVNDRNKRQEDCSGECECKCVIPNC